MLSSGFLWIPVTAFCKSGCPLLRYKHDSRVHAVYDSHWNMIAQQMGYAPSQLCADCFD